MHILLQVVKEADWQPPTPPKVDISLLGYLSEFKQNETPKPPKIPEVINDKERVFKEEIRSSDEVVLYSGACIVRTTKEGIKQSKKMREEEDEENERRFSGGRGGRAGGPRTCGGEEHERVPGARASRDLPATWAKRW